MEFQLYHYEFFNYTLTNYKPFRGYGSLGTKAFLAQIALNVRRRSKEIIMIKRENIC